MPAARQTGHRPRQAKPRCRPDKGKAAGGQATHTGHARTRRRPGIARRPGQGASGQVRQAQAYGAGGCHRLRKWKTDGIGYLNGGGGSRGGARRSCSRRRWREEVAARGRNPRDRKKATRERGIGSRKGCVFLCTRETNLPIVRRWGTMMGNHWRLFFCLFPKN